MDNSKFALVDTIIHYINEPEVTINIFESLSFLILLKRYLSKFSGNYTLSA